MAKDSDNDAELGRTKQSSSPRDHLQHLLNVGWDHKSPLIQKYARDNGLMKDLEDWVRQK